LVRAPFTVFGIRRKTMWTDDDRGSILIILAVVVLVLVLLFAGLMEYGRYLILREQTQTATDAAALAAAISGVERWVKISVYTDRGDGLVCDETGCWCSPCGIVKETVVGKERELIDEGGWERYTHPELECSCGGLRTWYVIEDRWVKYQPGKPEQAATAFFEANEPTFSEEARIRSTTVHSDQNDPYYPSVVVRAEAFLKSLWAGFMNVFPDRYKANTCSQAGTFYRDAQTGKWAKTPEDACQ